MMEAARREEILRRWFEMWLIGKDLGIAQIFSPDAYYVESWGPAYRGVESIRQWFEEWNTRGKVVSWPIERFFHESSRTVAQWAFRAEMYDGTVEAFDGMSLVEWNEEGQIRFLKEFGCNTANYDPYENGPTPHFRNEKPKWF